jgi:hypothetical protein
MKNTFILFGFFTPIYSIVLHNLYICLESPLNENDSDPQLAFSFLVELDQESYFEFLQSQSISSTLLYSYSYFIPLLSKSKQFEILSVILPVIFQYN